LTGSETRKGRSKGKGKSKLGREIQEVRAPACGIRHGTGEKRMFPQEDNFHTEEMGGWSRILFNGQWGDDENSEVECKTRKVEKKKRFFKKKKSFGGKEGGCWGLDVTNTQKSRATGFGHRPGDRGEKKICLSYWKVNIREREKRGSDSGALGDKESEFPVCNGVTFIPTGEIYSRE